VRISIRKTNITLFPLLIGKRGGSRLHICPLDKGCMERWEEVDPDKVTMGILCGREDVSN
jgi:hypothetical protein